MLTLLNIYVVLAVIIFAGGLITKVGRLFIHAVTNRKFSGVTKDFNGGPDKISYTEGLKAVLFDPITHFYRKANPSWNRGYMLYHIAIVTKATGYALAAVILFYNILMGNMIPDVAAHTEASLNYAPANLAALVFGSGEPLQAYYLFGGLGDAFMTITGVALIFAVVGNLHMVYTTLRNRGASAILHDIDQAAKNVRSNGFPKWDRILVRLIIFTIIYTDIAARLHLVDGAVFFHAFLGASLLLIFPFTYLFHMIYNVLALFYSSRRRVARTIA